MHRDYLPDPLAEVLDVFGGHYCIDCQLTVEPERRGEKRCLLCERAFNQHMRETEL